jgi:hypothetical protein
MITVWQALGSPYLDGMDPWMVQPVSDIQ